MCRAKYYEAKVKDLKKCKPAQWWKEIKQLSGFSKVERANPIADLQHLADEGEDPKQLANVINDAFPTLLSAFTPLATSNLYVHTHAHLQESPRPISEFSVFKKLSTLNTNKASGPDGIPSWVLKENADILAAPVSPSQFLEESRHHTPPKDVACNGCKQTSEAHFFDTCSFQGWGRFHC